MNYITIYLYIMIIFVAIAFWEAYVERGQGWARSAGGWRINLWVRELTAYHFWAWLVMIPMFLMLPLVIFGWNTSIFWLLVSACIMGTVLEDFLWFVVNPDFPFKDFNPKKVTWYKWLKLGKLAIPDFYIPYIVIAILILVYLV